LEWFDRLLQIGTGWLGWTEQETLNTSIPAIELAHEALLEKLRLIQAGAFVPIETRRPSDPMPADAVFEMFRRAAPGGPRE
jgi:hypothetical protein